MLRRPIESTADLFTDSSQRRARGAQLLGFDTASKLRQNRSDPLLIFTFRELLPVLTRLSISSYIPCSDGSKLRSVVVDDKVQWHRGINRRDEECHRAGAVRIDHIR